MGLLDRIGGITDAGEALKKIPIHAFMSILTERANGEITDQQVINTLALDAIEQAQYTSLVGKYDAIGTAAGKLAFIETIRSIFMLAELRIPGYTTKAQIAARYGRL